MKRLIFKTKPCEGVRRGHIRALKKEFYENQANKLPNEFRYYLNDYNVKNEADIFHIDENIY